MRKSPNFWSIYTTLAAFLLVFYATLLIWRVGSAKVRTGQTWEKCETTYCDTIKIISVYNDLAFIRINDKQYVKEVLWIKSHCKLIK